MNSDYKEKINYRYFQYVLNNPFLFSNHLHYRISRHIIFWLVALFSQSLVVLSIVSFSTGNNSEWVFGATYGQLIYLPGQLFFVYALLYFIIPHYIFNARYRKAVIGLAIICLITGIISGVSLLLLRKPAMELYYGKAETYIGNSHFITLLQAGFINGIQSALVTGGFSSSMKLLKHWYEKEYRNTILQKEKLNAELQVLKAQLHPHFLFNTLNNIYSITQESSPMGSEMIGRLSDLLRYILYECNQPFVSLKSELQLLSDYLALEKIRYDQNLDLSLSLPENTKGYQIAPLLLLPLVENCFKHGSSKIMGPSWIQIMIQIKESRLNAKFINSKPSCEAAFRPGLGLTNVQKRLNYLYPEKHQLSIVSEYEIFIATLSLQLDQSKIILNGKNQHHFTKLSDR